MKRLLCSLLTFALILPCLLLFSACGTDGDGAGYTVKFSVNGNVTKADRIRMVFEQRLGKVSKADIAMECPDISISTIEQTLGKLLSEGFIGKVGRGKQTAYVKR